MSESYEQEMRRVITVNPGQPSGFTQDEVHAAVEASLRSYFDGRSGTGLGSSVIADLVILRLAGLIQ